MSGHELRPGPATQRGRTAMAALQALDQSGIRYCILRNHDTIATEPGRDVDIVVDTDALPAVGQAMAAVGQSFTWDLVCECRGHHEGRSYYFLSRAARAEPVEQLEVHCTRVRWAGQNLLDEPAILDRRQRLANGLWVACARDQCVQLALHHALSRQLTRLRPSYRQKLHECASSHGGDMLAGLTEALGSPDAAARLHKALWAPDSAEDLIRELRWRFLRSAVERSGWSRALLGLVIAVSSKAIRRSLPRCGVLVQVPPTDSEVLVDRIHRLAQPMFLRIEAVRLDADTFPGHLRSCKVVNEAGLVVAVRPADGRASLRARALLHGAPTVGPDDSDERLKDVLVRAFASHHRILWAA